MKYKTIDICAGIGGIRRGFEMTGSFQNVLSVEIDKYARETYKHIFGQEPLEDIMDPKVKEKIYTTDYDILLAGFPCQTFSMAGKREGFSDIDRGTIYFHISEIIKNSRPKVVILENVKGLLNHNKGKTIEIIFNDLINIHGYSIKGVQYMNGKFVIDKNILIKKTIKFGLPQKRERVVLQCYRDGHRNIEAQPIINPIHKSLKDILDKAVNERYYITEKYMQTLISHKNKHQSKSNGFGFQVLDLEGSSNTLLATGGSGKERNMIIDEPNWKPFKKVGLDMRSLNKMKVRTLTDNEWAKLQGFKGYAFVDSEGEDKFSFPEKMSVTQRYKQLGNSVSIPVFESIAKSIVEEFNEIQ